MWLLIRLYMDNDGKKKKTEKGQWKLCNWLLDTTKKNGLSESIAYRWQQVDVVPALMHHQSDLIFHRPLYTSPCPWPVQWFSSFQRAIFSIDPHYDLSFVGNTMQPIVLTKWFCGQEKKMSQKWVRKIIWNARKTSKLMNTHRIGNISNGVEYIIRLDHVDGKNAK